MKKTMGRVRDLAILHSVISQEEGRENTLERFNSLVELEFRERLLRYVDRYKAAKTDDQKVSLKQKIGEVSRRILECKKYGSNSLPGTLKMFHVELHMSRQ